MTPKPANNPRKGINPPTDPAITPERGADGRCSGGKRLPKGVGPKRLAKIQERADARIEQLKAANWDQAIALLVLSEYLRERPEQFAAWATERATDPQRDPVEAMAEARIAETWLYMAATGKLWLRF
jgi:hypothetical protein